MASPIHTPTPTWQWVAGLTIAALGTIMLLVTAHLLDEFNGVKDAVHKLEISHEVMKQDIGFIRSFLEKKP
jgi:hypothetical protein